MKWSRALSLVGIGWYIAICILLGAGGGLWLDGVTHTRPLWTLLGLTLGLVLAMFGAYRMIMAVAKDDLNGGK